MDSTNDRQQVITNSGSHATQSQTILSDHSPSKMKNDMKRESIEAYSFSSSWKPSLAWRLVIPSFPCCLGGICRARREKTGSLTLLLAQTESTLQGWPPEDLLSGERRDTGAPAAIFFSGLLEAVIHFATAENAAETIPTSLGSANKHHKG